MNIYFETTQNEKEDIYFTTKIYILVEIIFFYHNFEMEKMAGEIIYVLFKCFSKILLSLKLCLNIANFYDLNLEMRIRYMYG